MGTSYCSVLHAVALFALGALFWIECNAHCAIRVLCAVYCQACCVSMLCSQQCTVCCVFTVRSTLPVVHCVCVRFPAPLMPVNRELVGRGQFLKYRHQPLLSMSPAGGCCLELPYNWQCWWSLKMQWMELCCWSFPRQCKCCVSLW